VPDHIKWHVEHTGDADGKTVVFPNGDTETLELTELESGIFRLEESSFFQDLRYHDVIQASLRNDGALTIKKIVVRSGLTTLDWIVSRELIDSEEFEDFLDYVESVGGVWERFFGGCLRVHVSPRMADRVVDRFNGLP
jgi:hypothetical protein